MCILSEPFSSFSRIFRRKKRIKFLHVYIGECVKSVPTHRQVLACICWRVRQKCSDASSSSCMYTLESASKEFWRIVKLLHVYVGECVKSVLAHRQVVSCVRRGVRQRCSGASSSCCMCTLMSASKVFWRIVKLLHVYVGECVKSVQRQVVACIRRRVCQTY